MRCVGPESIAAPLVSDVEAFTVRLSWIEPSQPNGIIVNYLLYSNDQLSHNVRTSFSALTLLVGSSDP